MFNQKNSLILFLLIIILFPMKANASVKVIYEYKDIGACYLSNKSDSAGITIRSEINGGKSFCFSHIEGTAVDLNRLEQEKVCGAYELYKVVVDKSLDETGVAIERWGYGCRKKVKQITNNLYCIYHYSKGAVMLADEGGKIKVKTQFVGIGDELPSYNDPDWVNVKNDVEILGTAIIEGGQCPNLVVERFTTEPNSTAITGFKFFNTEPSREQEDAFYGEYENYPYRVVDKKLNTYTEEFNVSGELEENPDASGNEYYTEFYGSEVNDIIENNEWTKKCTYMNGEYELYFNDTKFVMRNVQYTEEVDILANFTITELLNKNNKECPATLHYAADGIFIRFWLEDLDNGLNYRDDTTLYEGDNGPVDPGDGVYGCEVIPEDIRNWIKSTLNLVKYIALVLVIVLGILDFIKAAASGEAEQMKKSGSSFLKRIIAVVILFLLPVIVELVLNLIEIYGVDSVCLPE